jgi:hypothetical protein
MRTRCVCADMNTYVVVVLFWPPNIRQHVRYCLLFGVGKVAVVL